MTLQQLQTQLLALSPEEKAQAIQILVASISGHWVGIEKTPAVMGGDACIRQTRIPVWLLISQTRIPVWLLISLRSQGATEADLLEDYPSLTANDLANAWLYGEVYASEIDASIQRQEAA